VAFLDWMRRDGKRVAEPEPEHEPEFPRHFTRKGNVITQMSRSEWYSDHTGLYEFRHHVGRSAEGYHGGLEISYRGGEGPFSWSNARKTHEAAEDVSHRMRAAWEQGREGKGPKEEAASITAGDELPFRFQRPFAHMEHVMSPDERKVVEGIETRWKEQYERFKDYPPMSEGQEHERKVFKSVDRLQRALDARERGSFEGWKRLESEVNKAMGNVRQAFAAQRKYVGREVSEAKEYSRKLAPDSRREKPTRPSER